MTNETLAAYRARLKAELVAAFGPAEAAQLEARDDAMWACSEVYERMLTDSEAAVQALVLTKDGGEMLMRIAWLIAADQLRSAALGCDPPSWQETLTRHRVLDLATVEGVKAIFRKEAVHQ